MRDPRPILIKSYIIAGVLTAALLLGQSALAACADHDGQLAACVDDTEGCYYSGDLTGLCEQCGSVDIAQCLDPASGAVGSTSCQIVGGQCVGPNFVPEPDPICGDEIEDEGEQCDDGNTNNGDGCSSVCQVEPESGALLDQEQYDQILISGWQLAGQLFKAFIPIAFALAFGIAIVSFALQKLYASFRSDDKRDL